MLRAKTLKTYEQIFIFSLYKLGSTLLTGVRAHPQTERQTKTPIEVRNPMSTPPKNQAHAGIFSQI